jgi:hypothetical protein
MTEAKSQFGPEDTKLRPGETIVDLRERLAGMENRLAPVVDKLKEGEGKTPTEITIHPAMISAKKMEKKIHDQLEESGANKQLRVAAFECALFGTGVMKGPFAVDKEYPNWNDDGEYSPKFKTVPQTSSVSIWNFYPDPDAANMDEAEYVVERHKMSRSQLRALKNRPFFRGNAIDTSISMGESYTKEWWEQVMEDDSQESRSERFEVLEFWGNVDTEVLEGHDVDIPDDLKDMDQVSVNIWVCNGQVLRLVMNPFTPSIIPYYAVPYEVNPYNMFGVGLAENMDDTQTLMNGFMRMAVDNAALSGNMLIEVDETNLVPGQDLSVYPGKVFRRQGGAPGQAIFGTKFPNVSNENMQMFDKARVLADESTGFPSFAHGQTGVQGVGRTASGISMLMSAANGSIRNVIKNVDDYLLGPIAKAFFHFNMQFDFDEEIKDCTSGCKLYTNFCTLNTQWFFCTIAIHITKRCRYFIFTKCSTPISHLLFPEAFEVILMHESHLESCKVLQARFVVLVVYVQMRFYQQSLSEVHPKNLYYLRLVLGSCCTSVS